MTQTGTYTLHLRTPEAKAALHFRWKELGSTKALTIPIVFPTAFVHTPVVSLSLTGMEVWHEDISSFRTEATDITSVGFNVVLSVSPNNEARRLDLQWLATDA